MEDELLPHELPEGEEEKKPSGSRRPDPWISFNVANSTSGAGVLGLGCEEGCAGG